jgi:cbb3-type cytochrome oxidase cytochrome c subunit
VLSSISEFKCSLYSSHCIQLEGDENKEQKKQEKTKQKKNDWKNEIILKTTKKGTGYRREMISNARADLQAQAVAESPGAAAVAQRYPKAQIRTFDGDPAKVSELDALVAYLQVLGTLVDFAKFDAAGPNLR